MNQLELEHYNYLNDLKRRLHEVNHGNKGTLVKEAAHFMGCSEDTVYRKLNQLGKKPRKTRSDKNVSKISKEECHLIANVMMQSKRDSGKKLLPVEVVVDILKAEGKLRKSISAAHAGRMMKRYKVHPEQLNRPSPHMPQRSLFPNHVWEFDVSICVLYYLKGSTGLNVMPADEFYKNKPANLAKIANERVLRYVVTDHRSSAFYLEYFVTSGENAETLFHFLMNAFAKHHPEDPFHGVPWILKLDKGTANMSHMIMHLLELMNIEVIPHTPGNPRAKGQVEKTHDIIECHFEGRLFMMRIRDVQELNEQAHLWMRVFNSTKKHTRHKHSRYGLWQTIKADQLRIAPDREVCERILQVKKPIVCPVKGNLVISFAINGLGTLDYSVADIKHLDVGDEVTVWENPYSSPNLIIETLTSEGEIKTYEVTPMEKDDAGFYANSPIIGEKYKSFPQSQADKNRTAMNREAYGVGNEQDVKKARKQRKVAFNGEIDPLADIKAAQVPIFIDRKGHHMSVQAPHIDLEATVNWTRFGLKIKAVYGLSCDEIQAIKKQFNKDYPEGIPESQIKPYMQEIMNEEKTTQIRPG